MNRDLACAALSDLIYQDWNTVYVRLARMGMSMVGAPIEYAGSECMLVEAPGFAALVFRGTEASKGSASDIMSNLGIRTPWFSKIVTMVGAPDSWAGFTGSWEGKGVAHSGYSHHFSQIRDQARARAETVPTTAPLYVTGHSMGGVMAVFYAAWVGSGTPDDHQIMKLVTFGAPKGLSKEALATITARSARYTNRGDLAPWWQPGLTLSHPPGRIKVNSGGWWGPIARHGSRKYVKAVKRLG